MSLPTIDLSALMAGSLPMQVDGIDWKQTPIIQAGAGQIAVDIAAVVDGFLSSDNQTDLATAIAAMNTAGQTSGGNFNISGTGGILIHQLLAGNCYDGGPHVAFQVLSEGGGGGYRRVRATVNAKAFLSPLVSNFRRRITTKLDGLQTIEQTGSVIEPTPGTYFPTILAAFVVSFPAATYLTSYEVSNPGGYQNNSQGQITTTTDLTCQYRISSQQLASALPTGGSVTVVDGEFTTRTDRDEQQRLITTFDYALQLKVTGSPSYAGLVAALTPSGQIVRQKVDFSNIKAWKLGISFTVLASNDGDGLLDFHQTIEWVQPVQAYEMYTYPGISPIAVAKPAVFARIRQSGSMTGLGDFFDPPAAVLSYFANQPEIAFEDVSNYEKRTSWKYEFLDADGVASADMTSWLAGIARPSSGGLTTIGP